MKFVADENIDHQIVDRLRQDGHIVMSVAEMDPGISDYRVDSRFCRNQSGSNPYT